MIAIRTVSCFLVIAAYCGHAQLFGQEKKADPRESLETAIPEAIRLLEAKDYRSLLKAFVAPEDLKKFSERGGFEDFVTKFSSRKAPSLLATLNSIKGIKPTLKDEDRTAVFEFKEPIQGKTSITFVKIDKYWYLQN